MHTITHTHTQMHTHTNTHTQTHKHKNTITHTHKEKQEKNRGVDGRFLPYELGSEKGGCARLCVQQLVVPNYFGHPQVPDLGAPEWGVRTSKGKTCSKCKKRPP